MKTRKEDNFIWWVVALWFVGMCVCAVKTHGAQLQTYPQVGSLGANDLVPFSEFLGGTSYQSPVNITGLNFANSLATVGNYPMLAANNNWGGTQVFSNGFLSIGPATFDNSLAAIAIGAPNSLIWANGFTLRSVSLGPNVFLSASGVLTIATNVGTNNIPIPVPIADGGTGDITAPNGLLNLGGARLDGTTQFPKLFDSGPATNQLLVLEGLSTGQQLTAIGAAPGNGYTLGSTNTTPGVAWFPNPAGTRVTGNTTATGWTNTTGVSCYVIFGTTANTIWVSFDPIGPYATNTFGGPNFWTTIVVPGGSYVITFGTGFVGQYHSLLQ